MYFPYVLRILRAIVISSRVAANLVQSQLTLFFTDLKFQTCWLDWAPGKSRVTPWRGVLACWRVGVSRCKISTLCKWLSAVRSTLKLHSRDLSHYPMVFLPQSVINIVQYLLTLYYCRGGIAGYPLASSAAAIVTRSTLNHVVGAYIHRLAPQNCT
ncbi:hypothetical protein C8F04DRAFT_1188828 [Mycena alexandri]|uniref:Uncharacterized protein n=1 Tax=Mycena alexandri TaxID=1745969 RepID=A0AAD6SHI8_9AGAR|nr:hypothetical protein C8F04DRAFT_1188828 [Mycena alexandri]